eukprot:6067853-Amphidinium_carterae.1
MTHGDMGLHERGTACLHDLWGSLATQWSHDPALPKGSCRHAALLFLTQAICHRQKSSPARLSPSRPVAAAAADIRVGPAAT